jgi:hypothetical protein
MTCSVHRYATPETELAAIQLAKIRFAEEERVRQREREEASQTEERTQ